MGGKDAGHPFLPTAHAARWAADAILAGTWAERMLGILLTAFKGEDFLLFLPRYSLHAGVINGIAKGREAFLGQAKSAVSIRQTFLGAGILHWCSSPGRARHCAGTVPPTKRGRKAADAPVSLYKRHKIEYNIPYYKE
ncbi:MAG: hypothetical protein PHO66_02495 [Eubacteriales bacterium]|nr:hypothetical protein [Eubacteriales bacterium]